MAETDTGKLRQPLSYIEWIRTVDLGYITENELFVKYSEYVREFYADRNAETVTNQELINNIYKELLKDITLNYTTADEKRFLSKINFDDKSELDIIVPYFVQKLKQITQYLVGKRQDVQFSKIRNSFKGSHLGVTKTISDKIISLFNDPDFRQKYPTSNLPTASAVSKNVGVGIKTLYDTYQNYYDIDPDVDSSVYTQSVSSTNHYQQFGSNAQFRNSKAFVDLEGAVEDIFAELPQILSTACSDDIASDINLDILINTTRSDIQELPYNYFVDSLKTEDNLILEYEKEISKKYTGTSMYYLSTGSTATDYVSGVLYESKNSTANLLNRYFPSRASVPNINNLSTLKDIGGFFTPTKHGILNYSTPTFTYKLDTANLLPDTLYVFPDPDVYAAGRGNTKIDQPSPFKHTDDVTIIKADVGNTKLQGDIVDATNVHKMWPYQSTQETLKTHPTGISRSTDNVDYWTGTKKDIWGNADIYPLYFQQPLPVQDKLDDLLVSNNILYQWRTDIFGNEYALFKNTHPIRQTTAQQLSSYTTSAIQSIDSTFLNDLTGVHRKKLIKYYDYQLGGYTTQYDKPVANISTESSIYDKHDILGHWYVRTPLSTIIAPVSSTLSGVFVKYKSRTELYDELKYNVKNFDVVKDVLIVETDNYIVVEQLKYNAITDAFTSNLQNRVFISLSGNNRDFENFGNIWYNDTDNKIYLTTVLLHPYLSGSNYKAIYPQIYEYNIGSSKLTLMSPASSTYDALLSDGFSLSGTGQEINIVSVARPHVSYNIHDNTCVVTYTGLDPANKMYTTLIYYDTSDSVKFDIIKCVMFKPMYTSIVNYHADNFVKTDTLPSISANIEGPLSRGSLNEEFIISVDGFTSETQFPTGGDIVQSPLSFPLAGTSTAYKALSGNPRPAVTKVDDQTTNTFLFGHGLSSNETFQPSTNVLPYTHNSSYMIYNIAMDPTIQDIEVYVDVALYTLTTGNSAYKQTLVTSTSSFDAIETTYSVNRAPGGGLCVYYFDAENESYPAGIGSALGYSNYTGPMGDGQSEITAASARHINGVRGGYVGVGFDVEGNFGNTTDGKTGLSGTGYGTSSVTTNPVTTVSPNTVTLRSQESEAYKVLTTTSNLSTYPVAGSANYSASPAVTLHQYTASRNDVNFHKIRVSLQNGGKRVQADILNTADGKFYPYLEYNLAEGISVPAKLRVGISFATSDYFTNCEIKNFAVYGDAVTFTKNIDSSYFDPPATNAFTVTTT
jgi:hypothetical protein